MEESSPSLFQVDYCASKFACVGLDEALRVETLVQVNNCWRSNPPRDSKPEPHLGYKCWEWVFRVTRTSWRPPSSAPPTSTLACLMECRWYFFHPFLEPVPFWQKSLFPLFQSKIIQILDPQFVADQVVDATLSDKPILMLPCTVTQNRGWWVQFRFWPYSQ